MAAYGADYVQSVLKVKANAGGTNLKIKPCIQTAALRQNNPDSSSNIGSVSQSGNGEEHTGVEDVSSTTGSKLWFRLGVSYALASGPGEAFADVYFQSCIQMLGKMLSARTLFLFAPSTTAICQPFTEWTPVSMVYKARPAIFIDSPTTDFRCRWCYQLAETSVQSPGSWTTPDSGNQPWLSSGENMANEYAPSYGNPAQMWIRFGIEYKSNGADDQSATVTTTFNIRK
jgi:hypothetical protein